MIYDVVLVIDGYKELKFQMEADDIRYFVTGITSRVTSEDRNKIEFRITIHDESEKTEEVAE